MSTETETTWDSLPPELWTRIFNDLRILDKRRARLVCTFWRDVIDSHPNIAFHVELTNNNAEWVANLTWPNIEYLRIDELTTDFDISNSFPDGIQIKTLSIGADNSFNNFWTALRSCNKNQVQHLELVCKPGMDLGPLDFPVTYFESIKVLTMKVENIDVRGQEEEFLRRGWGSVLKILTLPSVETISFQLDCSTNSYPSCLLYLHELLKRNSGIKALLLTIVPLRIYPMPDPEPPTLPLVLPTNLQLEKLDLRLDFRIAPHVIPLVQTSNHTLKQLRLKHINPDKFDRFGLEGYNLLVELIHQNSASLEFLSITSHSINFAELHLENRHSLKILKLKARTITSVPEGLQIPNIEALTITRIDSGFDSISSVLALLEQGLEKFTLDYYEGFDILQLRRISSLLNIKKIVLRGMSVPPPLISAYCSHTPNIKTVWVNKYGRDDYHITKTDFL